MKNNIDRINILNVFKDSAAIVNYLRENKRISKNVFFDVLLYSVRKKDEKILNLLIELFIEGKCELDVNDRDDQGLTPLALTVMYNNFEFFQKLMLLGASPVVRVERNISVMDTELRSKTAACSNIQMDSLSIAVDFERVDMLEYMRDTVDKKLFLAQALRLVGVKGKDKIIQLLLKDSEELIKRSVFEAIDKQDADTLNLLLKLNQLKSLDFVNEEGWTPLIFAVKKRDYLLFDVLKNVIREKKISIDIDYVANGTNALDMAMQNDDKVLTKQLLFMGANPVNPLTDAEIGFQNEKITKTPFFNIVKKALKEGKNPSILQMVTSVFSKVDYVAQVIKIAKFFNTKKVYGLLLENKMDLSMSNAFHARLIRAVKENDVDFVDFLTKRRVSPFVKIENETAFEVAVKTGKLDILDVFVNEYGIKKINTVMNQISPVNMAIWSNQEEVARYLLKKGYCFSNFYISGESVLNRIIDFDMGNLLKDLILKKRIEPCEMQNMLWLSILFKRKECLRILCDSQMDVNFQNKFGVTPFLLAVKRKNIMAAVLLFYAGASIEAADDNGSRALHIATMQGNLKLCVWLLLCKANVNAKNNKGETPLMLAMQNGFFKIEGILRSFGANTKLTSHKMQLQVIHNNKSKGRKRN